MTITIKELKECGIDWSDVCRVTGGNEWAINEGLLDEDSSIELTIEEARKIGLLEAKP